MKAPFQDLCITGLISERCYPVEGSSLRIYLQLSQPAPLGWAYLLSQVWQAVEYPGKRPVGIESDARYRNLCRRLGFGMLAVTNTGDVEVIVKPPDTAPRRNPKKRSRLVAEHRRRKGDPAMGGSTRAPIMTAYRQQALACASALSGGPRRVKDLRPEIPDAGKILLHNVYGWFDRAERGVYVLTDAGRAALKRWPQQPMDLSASNSAP